MTKADPETRSITMNLRTTPTIKAMVEALSEVEERSIANVIERLIRDAAKAKGLNISAPKKKAK